jgi:hypothetical protein
VPADAAQRTIETIVERKAPVIEDFGGFLKVLNPELSAGDHCMVLTYQVGARGATLEQLTEWVRPGMRANIRRTLARLTDDRAYLHYDGDRFRITRSGINYVEDNGLIQP